MTKKNQASYPVHSTVLNSHALEQSFPRRRGRDQRGALGQREHEDEIEEELERGDPLAVAQDRPQARGG